MFILHTFFGILASLIAASDFNALLAEISTKKTALFTETLLLDFLPEEEDGFSRPDNIMGDMFLSETQWTIIDNLDFSGEAAVIPESAEIIKSWPSAEIPVVFDSGISDCQRLIVREALHRIENATCLRFPIRNISDAILFKSDKSIPCMATLGYQNGSENFVNIKTPCGGVGNVQHLIFHTLGIMHTLNLFSLIGNFSLSMTNADRSIYGSQEISAIFSPYDFRSAWTNAASDLPADFSSISSLDVCALSSTRFLGTTDCVETISVPGLSHFQAVRMIGNRDIMTKQDALVLNRMFSCPIKEEISDSHFLSIPKNPNITQRAVVDCAFNFLVPARAEVAATVEPGDGGSLAKHSQKKKVILIISITTTLLLAMTVGYLTSKRARQLIDGEDVQTEVDEDNGDEDDMVEEEIPSSQSNEVGLEEDPASAQIV